MNPSIPGRTNAVFKPAFIAFAISSVFPSLVFSQTVRDQNLEPVIVTASRTEQKIRDVLNDTIVITAEEIAQSGQTSLIELLQQKRGIEIARNGGAGTVASVFIRGANSNQMVLLIDGVRSVSSTSGAPDWSVIPLSQIDRIELVLGPLSSMYGADAVGGVIQVFTKKGDGSPRLVFSAGAGTYGEKVVTAGVSGSTGGDHAFRYSINASTEEAKGFSATLPHVSFGYNPDKDGYSKRSMAGQFSLDLAQGHEIGFRFLNSLNEAAYDNGASTYNDHAVSEANAYSIYSRNQLTKNWTSLFQVSRSYTNSLDYKQSGLTQNNSKQDTFSWQNDIKIGSDLLQLIAERREEKVKSTNTGLGRERTNDSFSAAYQAKRGAHLASAALRFDDNSDYGSHVTGSVGYGYVITDALRAATSYGTSFRAPTYADLYVPWGGIASNKPEKGKNAEVGLYYDNGTSTVNAVYYRNRVKDLLLWTNTCPVPGNPFGCTTNVDDALLTGISLGASSKIANNFTLHASLDVQDPRDKTTDKLLARRAKYHGVMGIDYVASGLTTGADIVFSDYRFDNAANTDRLGGYALLNLRATYDLGNNWQVFGRWNNVLDKSYELAKGYQTPSSNVFVGVRYGFK